MHAHPRVVQPSADCPRLTPFDAYLITNNIDPTALEVKVHEADSCLPNRQPNRRRPGTSREADLTDSTIGRVKDMARAM